MKFKLIFLILLSQSLFCQEKAVVYENDATAYWNKSRNEFSNEETYCDLTINPDSTFSFYSRPAMSCFTWHEIEGKWKKRNEIYTFSSQYEVSENDTRISYNQNSSKKFLLKFKTDKNSELMNRNIKIEYLYDFDSKLEDVEKSMNFNQNNIIEIQFSEIPNFDKLASIRILYLLNSKDRRDGYITKNKYVNVREVEIPNVVEIEFVEIPKKETIYRTTIAKLHNGKLEIISNDKTKTTLPEYLSEIGFEKYYNLRK